MGESTAAITLVIYEWSTSVVGILRPLDAAPTQINVVLNWLEKLKRRVPGRKQ
jgi:hypothetical protein